MASTWCYKIIYEPNNSFKGKKIPIDYVAAENKKLILGGSDFKLQLTCEKLPPVKLWGSIKEYP